MKTKTVPLNDLVPDPENARRHTRRNLRAIAASLKRFGQVLPVLVRAGTHEVVGGNGTVQAMRALGWTQCAIVETDKTGAEARALAIALNRSAELAEWNDDMLAAQLRAQLNDYDLESFGWDAVKLQQLLVRDDELPEFEDIADNATAGGELVYKLVITCTDEEHQGELLDRLETEGLEVEPLIS